MWFVGDDWAEEHHDVEVQDESGRRLGRARLPEGSEGVTRLHALIAGAVGSNAEPDQVLVGIETDRGPWVAALVAAGYRVFAINPRQVARARERHGTSGAKSDAGDAHTLADLVRTDAHQLRPIAGDSPLVEGIKVIARAHQNLIWDRHRQMLRLRGSLREFFPAARAAWPDLTAPDAVELLAAAPDPERAARLSRSKIAAALRRARRRDVEARAEQIQATLRGRQLTQPAELAGAYAVTVRAQVALIATLNTQITDLGEQVEAHFGRHRTLRYTAASPGWVSCSAPGCSVSSVMTATATTVPALGRTTRDRPRSPAPRARRRWCSPGTCATGGSPTPCTSRPSARCGPHRAPAPTTTSCAPAEPGTTPPSASWPTASSASCTAV